MCLRYPKERAPKLPTYTYFFPYGFLLDSAPRQDPYFYSPQNKTQYHIARKPITECGEGLNLLPNVLLITLFIMTHTFLSSISVISLCVCKSRMTLYTSLLQNITHTQKSALLYIHTSYFNKWLTNKLCVTLSLNTFLAFMLITPFFEIVISPVCMCP